MHGFDSTLLFVLLFLFAVDSLLVLEEKKPTELNVNLEIY